jgi:hypothetical protein
MCQNVPDRAGMCRPSDGFSAARAGARPLSPQQLAAVRQLAQGAGSVRVARQLGVNRHTIARWKRDPRFVAELRRLQREMRAVVVAPAIARAAAKAKPDPLAEWWFAQQQQTSARTPAPTEPSPADDELDLDDDLNDDFDDEDDDDDMTDEEAQEVEDWVNRVLIAAHKGEKIPKFPPRRPTGQ